MNTEDELVCCVCFKKWHLKDMNFHNLCWNCFGLYDKLKRAGRMAERSGSACTDSERFFSSTLFPFIDSSGVELLRKEIGFKINLVEVGENKALVTRAVRDVCNLSLREAKDLIENLPKTLKDDMLKNDALAIKKMFEGIGAKVELTNPFSNNTHLITL
jgi:hypothetical protein